MTVAVNYDPMRIFLKRLEMNESWMGETVVLQIKILGVFCQDDFLPISLIWIVEIDFSQQE